MEKANLPTEKAFEPNEEAHQPLGTMTPRLVKQTMRKQIAFAEDTDNDNSPSQKSSNYKEVLSQPAPGLTHRQKLLWLQKRRAPGLWAQCDECNRWRYLSNVLDSYELPKKWYCRMNPDTTNNDCSIPEAPIRVREEEDLIHSEYSAGSVVWARMPGWPWWPAMVNDCPDTEQFYWLDGFSDIPTHYNVVFFDSTEVTRAWIAPENLKPYTEYKNTFKPFLKDKKNKNRLRAAVKQADDATQLSLSDRLEKYSFTARYKGNFNSPKKISKNILKKHQKYMKRKFNIEFETSESDEDDEMSPPVSPKRNKNVILLGTPKRPRTIARRISKDNSIDVTDTEAVTEKTVEVEPSLENVETDKTDTEPATNASNNDSFKRPNSLVVQVGSTTNSAMVEEPFDDDTSKTYVPEKQKLVSQESTESTQNNTVTLSEITEFEVRIATPTSDDFDF